MRPLSALAVALLLAAAPAAAQAPGPPPGGCHYEIALADAEARRLDVALRCAGDGPFSLATFGRLADAHIIDVAAAPGSTLATGETWRLVGRDGEARARYGIDVDALAAASGSATTGRRLGGSVVASVRSFLLLPEAGRATIPVTLRFRAPPGAAVLTALAREGDLHRLYTADLPWIGFMAMGRIAALQVPVPAPPGAPPDRSAVLDIAVLDGAHGLAPDALRHWVGESAGRVAAYFGGFPTRRGLLIFRPVAGRQGLLRGVVTGGAGASMLMLFGADTEASQLFGQWMLMHELVHFGGPLVEDHAWLMEGMAVYVETGLRVRAGWFPADLAWRGMLRNFRHGVLAIERDGLARARGTGPVYWGGTLFMLLAEIDILERSKGARSLADCLRAVLAAGGDTTQRWTLDRFVAVCDAATGTGTFARLVAAHVHRGTRTDLPALWRRLGVALVESGEGIRFDDAAPLAWVRKRILAPPAP